jgi:DNA-binding IclR family transcriptional regulator
LEELQSVQNIRFTASKGYIAPLYTGSAGKVLLAELKENELNLLLKNIDLVAVGPNTITDEKFLRKEVKKVRKRGYATSFGERIEGSASISVPVRNYICPVALSVLGPDNRFKPRMMDVLQEMQESAENISKRLMEGFQGREVP